MNAETIRRARSALCVLGASLAIAACGGAGGGEADGGVTGGEPPAITTPSASDAGVTTPASPPATTRSSSPDRGASSSTAASSPPRKPKPAPTTTVAPTPSTVSLPRPIAPPLDDEAPEPVVPLGRISIPAIGIDRPMFEGIRLPTFDLGPGHWPGTAMPGQIGNMVLGGHRTSSFADFADMDLLAPGDEVIVTTNDGASFTYVVETTEITDPNAQRVVQQTEERTGTLFACHPKGSVRQRIVVHLALRA